ncbi:MAG: NUMOD4 domain-containing protein, partial [Sarcina sp.]
MRTKLKIKYMSRFKEIEGYPNYFITDCGDVYSSKHGDMKKLSQRINSRGYFYVNLCKGGKYKSVSVHRIVGKHFVEKHEGLDIINHIDGCKTNNNYKNLEWCTLKHNSSEAFRIGLS